MTNAEELELSIAKFMADRIGHGMREKCQPHALAVMEWLTHVYNAGYHAGHEDTVDGYFTRIHSSDMNSRHDDEVAELVCDLVS